VRKHVVVLKIVMKKYIFGPYIESRNTHGVKNIKTKDGIKNFKPQDS